MQHLFRQIHYPLRSIFIEPLPVGTDSGIGVLDVLLLLEVGEVLSIAYGHTPVLPSFLVEYGFEMVKLPLATKGIDQRSFTTKKQGSEVVWFRHLERICKGRTEGTLLLDGEGILFGGVGLQAFKGRIHSDRLKRQYRYVAHLVAYVLGVYLHDSRQGLCDPVYPEGLRGFAVRRGCRDDAGVLHFLYELSVYGVLHM